MTRRKGAIIPDAMLDSLLGGADAKTAFDGGGLIDPLKKALAERELNTEKDLWSCLFRSTGNRVAIRNS